MDERPDRPAQTRWDDEERGVSELLERAGARPEVPDADLEEITATARSAWQACWGAQPLPRSRWSAPGARLAMAAGLAAALALAVGLGWGWRSLRPAGPPEVVAHVESVSGPVGLGDGAAAGAALGQPVPAGTVITTGGATEPEGRASLRLATGATVRLDAESRLRLVSASVLQLDRGTVYVDTGSPERPGAALEVRTTLGVARDVGTQFLVRLVGAEAEALAVRVREGVVAVERGGQAFRAGAGRELVLHRDGRVERRPAAGHGPAWEWTMAAAPAFELEGRTLAELLAWVSRETGWRLLYEDPELAAAAEGIVLHGSLGELRPDQAPFALLPSAGLEGELRGGVLVVQRP